MIHITCCLLLTDVMGYEKLQNHTYTEELSDI